MKLKALVTIKLDGGVTIQPGGKFEADDLVAMSLIGRGFAVSDEQANPEQEKPKK